MADSFERIFGDAQKHHADGALARAEQLYQNALLQRPGHARCHYFLGLVRVRLQQFGPAADSLVRAIELNPATPEYHCDLAAVFFALDDLPASIAAAQNALRLREDFPKALMVLGNAFCRSGRYEEGIQAYQRLLTLRPEEADAINNLGMAMFQLSRVDEAVACFGRLTQLNPADASAQSNRIYAMQFSSSATAADMKRELDLFQQRYARPLESEAFVHRQVARQAQRTECLLRIGFVSPDFREHVVGWNLLSWLKDVDQKRFQTICYSSTRVHDQLTRELQSLVHGWREIGGLSDGEAAQLIYQERIDILVDLASHTGGNRLLLFARKPAPVQVTYLAYPGSTGLAAMDYRISDPYLNPENSPGTYTEQTVRLPDTYWCYRPGGPTPAVVPTPAIANGQITFCSLNQFQKASRSSLDLWREIMRKAPRSRLLLHCPEGDQRKRLLANFEEQGIAAQRVTFVPRLPWPQYIRLYEQADIALDPFPYGGGITSCDALWMGVPLITLEGDRATGRSGASILRNLQLGQFVARSPTEYADRALALAGDLYLLSRLRAGMRQRMLASPLMNSVAFARDMERLLEKIWASWALAR